ncbi:DUF4386 domain-containing protein [Antarcticimicrobium sediminis]|uniref:DUF4386 domain-containing protein n=1 Tax=Antarcticimicrobium sediminis TaxID=2546227 RepID=A0A4R5F0C4_9RHOB|nr:DUF4386 domain-containing protein [Antarcticimicrobium sediminis]TDE40905.1 DUF4386 domain-containing protein [Antarcticimicrobium sediminis]
MPQLHNVLTAPTPALLPESTRVLFTAAGLLYLVIISCGVWSEGIARGALITPGLPELSQKAITAAPVLWRLSIVADLTMLLADVGIAAVFLRLFAASAPVLAPLAFALRLVQAALIGAALLPLTLADALAPAQLDRALTLHALGYDLGLVFFGVNCAVMAAMLRGAGLAGRLIPLALAASGAIYLAGSLTALVAPGLNAAMQPAYALPLLAESGFCIWLMARGLRRPRATPSTG